MTADPEKEVAASFNLQMTNGESGGGLGVINRDNVVSHLRNFIDN